MSMLYVDESIHVRGNFIVIAAVYSPLSLDHPVFDALSHSGFAPKVDEFKSSMLMNDRLAAQDLRSRLRYLLFEKCKVGVAICPVDERRNLMLWADSLIHHMVNSNSIPAGTIYLDAGIEGMRGKPPIGWAINANCDSRVVGGIQVADCAAHMIGVLLLSQMGIVNKMVPSDGYPEPEVDLGFELWASLRYSLSSNKPTSAYDADGYVDPTMKPFGLIVSENCPEPVKRAIEERLSTVWVGCIH